MVRLPVIDGVIRRRLLVNFRVQPEVIQRQLPKGFRPKLHDGSAIAGICLIRLEQVRPKGLPAFIGHQSENAAHRVAVLWEGGEGVYIPRRDSNSLLNQLAGGRIFPGEHHAADFRVRDTGERIELEMKSRDGLAAVELRGQMARELPATSRFASLAEASSFFQGGSIGYSASAKSDRLDGLALDIRRWQASPLSIEMVRSSWFDDRERFPEGSVEFDCALLMRDVEHEWHGLPSREAR
jgi:hypothetical protein